MATAPPERTAGHSLGYEWTVVLLLGLAFGFAYFDRMAMTFLAPYVVKDLGLSNTQVGALGSALSLTWALGAFLIGLWSDAVGRRKPFLLAFMVIFSICSVLSGLAGNFSALLASRALMGAVEGPFLPICLAIIAAASVQRRRGLNVGIVQNFFGSAIGTAIAPIVLVWLADHYGWRSAFYLAAVPGLLLAFLVWRFIREPELPPRPAGQERQPLDLGMLANRNIAICSLLSCMMVGSLVLGSIFLPLYFTGPRGWDPKTMSFVMAVLGLTPGLGGVLISWISDHVGRRPPMIVGCFLAALCPAAALWFGGSIPALAAIMFVSWLGIGVFPLFMGVVPGETIGHAKAATAMGLVVGIGELSGGFLGPLIGGRLADLYGLQAPLLIQGGLALIAGVVAFALVETNPQILARRAEEAVA